ncbi:D-alanyl-D-alanine carboxypeptidase family protein [Phormidium sp. CCY1219]|uniref:M15 family metallopeptidase n=1 Tax=Phormidium sp. CCY1219 TaxID=2886104 RepID=UPI003FA6829D
MDKAGLSENKSKTSAVMAEDIPEAVRDTPNPETPSGSKPMGLILGLLATGAIALLAGVWFALQAGPPTVGEAPENTQSPSPTPEAPQTEQPTAEASPTPTAANGEPSETDEGLLGHLPYEQASPEDLQAIVSDGSIKLRQTAAEAFLDMQAAARAEGIYLVPISGFRTVEDQQYLFFEIKAQRGQVASERAEVSAPPGYSEHHTGYAVDIGDANVPATHVNENFENTAAFQWLEANAAYFSFELSFPKDNPQGVAYEPWHWRFVGDRHSLETFYKARGQE